MSPVTPGTLGTARQATNAGFVEAKRGKSINTGRHGQTPAHWHGKAIMDEWNHARMSFAALPMAVAATGLRHERPRLVAAQPYAASLHASFSGSTFYLADAGIKAGDFDGAFGLVSEGLISRAELYGRAAIWRARERLNGRAGQGYKFEPGYRAHFWERSLPRLHDTDIVNNFQLYGRAFHAKRSAHGVGAYFYIDGTLTNYFEEYDDFETAALHPDLRARAIAEERDGYHSADAVIVMSEHAAETLRARYGVDPARVHVVVPGANVPADLTATVNLPQTQESFTLGFVGIFPQRKGLDRLAAAVGELRRRNLDVRLRVIGRCPPAIAAMEGVEDRGFIDKLSDPQGFAEALAGVHIGCLLSRAELAGIAAVEFLKFGIPVLGSGVGGMKDILKGGGSLMCHPDMPTEQLANLIGAFIADRASYDRLKEEAVSRSRWACWTRATAEISGIVEQFAPVGHTRSATN